MYDDGSHTRLSIRKMVFGVAGALMMFMALIAIYTGSLVTPDDATILGNRKVTELAVQPTQLNIFSIFNPTPSPPAPKEGYGMKDPINAKVKNKDLPPFVFYTGLTGASLYATLDKPGGLFGYGCGPSVRCACKSSTYQIYFSISQMVAYAPCFLQNFALNWNSGTKIIEAVPGVNITTNNGPSGFDPNGYGFGSPGVSHPGAAAWKPYMELLMKEFNYTMAQFRTVVWDWRLGPNEWMSPDKHGLYETGNFAKHKVMFEGLYEKFGQKIMVATISEGGTIFKSFLDYYVDQAWKDKYIQGWYSYSGVFAGASDMAYAQMSGEKFYETLMEYMSKKVIGFGLKTFTSDEFRQSSANFPGQAAVSPIKTGDKKADDMVLFVTPSKNYTFLQYTEALRAAGLTSTAEVMDSVEKYRPNFKAPGVRTWCIYGTGVATPGQFVYDFDFDGTHNAKQPSKINTIDGDGTVHAASLEICNQWTSTASLAMSTSSDTTVHTWEGFNHVGILTANVTYPLLKSSLTAVIVKQKASIRR